LVTGASQTMFLYDAQGNLSEDGTTTYAWNARGQLSALLVSGVQELTGANVPSARLLTELAIDEVFSRTVLPSGPRRTFLV